MSNNKLTPYRISEPSKKKTYFFQEMVEKGVPWAPFLVIGLVLSVFAAVAVSIDFGFSTTYIAVGGAIGLLFTFLVIQNPELGAYLLVISVFSSLSDILTDRGLPSINRPLIALIAFSIFLNYFQKTGRLSKLPTMTRTEWALVAYYSVIIFSSSQVVDKSRAFSSILDITKDILVGISIFVLLNTKDKWEKGAWVLIITMTVLSSLGLIKMISGTSTTFWDFAQFSQFGQVDEAGNLRFGGPIAEANIWGQVLTATLPFAVFPLFKDSNIIKKIFLSFSTITILLAIFFTGSRGAFIALIALIPIIVFETRTKLSYILFGLALITVLLIFLPSSYTQRLQTLSIFFDQSDEYALSRDDSIVGRRNSMLTGLAMFRDNPFFGVGFGNYGINYYEYASDLGLETGSLYVNNDTDLPQAHSLYVEILSETGLLGILTFAVFIGLVFRGLFKARNRYLLYATETTWVSWINALIASILSFLITGIFLHGIFFRYIWMLIGMALAILAISNETPPTPLLHRRSNHYDK
jgi:putative inorganic carbon (hco3(-)) transporter